MKLINSVGPNPHVVRMFMAERGIDIPLEDLDDGSVVTEITAICEYLDEKFPGDRLIGDTPEERAQNRRWTRWVDLNIVEPMGNAFRSSEGLPMFKDRMRCIPEAADGLKACAQDKIKFLDARLVAGDDFGLADILLFCFQAFGNAVGQPVNPEFKNYAAWFAKVGERPSAKA